MVPTAAADGLVHMRRRRGRSHAIAPSQQARAAADRELVDLRGPVTQTALHKHYKHSPLAGALTSILRPTRSCVVTDSDIGRCSGRCNVTNSKSVSAQFVSRFAVAVGEGGLRVTNAWALAKV